MYKRILVAVALDHEHDAQPTMDLANRLLESDGRITALHVLEEIPGYAEQYLPSDRLENRYAEAKARLKEQVDGQKQVEPVVITGHSGRSIVEYAKNHDIDCIVIASHQPGLQDYFLGSTAGRVVRHAHCSVHVIR